MNTRSCCCWGSFRAPPRLRPNCCRHQRRPSVAALDGRPLASRFTDARSMTREVARGGIGIMGSGTSTISTVSWRARGCFLGSRKPQAPAHSRFTQSCNGLRLSASSKDRSGVYRLAAPPIPSDADLRRLRSSTDDAIAAGRAHVPKRASASHVGTLKAVPVMVPVRPAHTRAPAPNFPSNSAVLSVPYTHNV